MRTMPYRANLMRVIFGCMVLLTLFSSADGQVSLTKLTFDQFLYAGALVDTAETQLLQRQLHRENPEADNVRCLSLLSTDPLIKIVSHYAILTERRYELSGGRIIFPFKRRLGTITDRIEIMPQAVPHVAAEWWPTRINLIQFDFPLMKATTLPVRAVTNLRELAGRFYYNGELREDVAAIIMEELGEVAQVYVVDTRDTFEQVYRFFRQRYGRIRIIPAFNGEIMERDFDIAVNPSTRGEQAKRQLHIRVLENPLVTDREGNSYRYIGHVFIQYTFWREDQTESD